MSKDTQALKQFKILIIGDSCTDIYQFGSCSRLSPEAPVPVLKMSSTKTYNGMASNVFQNLSALNNEVFLFTQEETITKTRIVEEKFNHHILRIDSEPRVRALNWDKYPGPPIKDFDAFVISDYDKGFLTDAVIKDLVPFLKSFSKPIFVDTKKKSLEYFSNCIIKINQEEFERLTCIPHESNLIVTYGSMGARWNELEFPAIKTDVFDVCGAGDTFLAGLVDSYLISKSFPSSIEFANKCASIAVTNFGTYCLKDEDIEEIRK